MSNRQPFAYATKGGAVVLKETLDKYALKVDKEKEGESRKLREDEFKYTKDNLKTPLYNPNALVDLLELNTYHARCVSTKATDIGGLGYILEGIGDNPSQANYDKVKAFLDKCFPLFEEVATRCAYDKQAIGWGVLELIRYGNMADGEPTRLEHIPSHTIRIHKEGNKFLMSWDGISKRWFKRIGYDKDIDIDDGSEHPLGSLDSSKRATELIFDINYTPKSTYYGAPDIIPAMKSLIGDISAVEYNIYFFKNYGVPDYAIFITGDFEDEPILDPKTNLPTGRSKMQEMLENQMKRVIDEPHSNMIISIPSPEGSESAKVEVKFEKLSVDIKESAFRLYRMENRDEIITAEKTDPYRVGVLPVGSLGGNLGSETKKNYKVSTVVPNQRILEAYINIFIIQDEKGLDVQDWKLKLVTIDTEDEAHDMLLSKEAVASAGMTPNQFIRKWKDRLGLEEVDHPAMNAHYLNGTPIDYVPEGEVPVEVIETLKALKNYLEEMAEEYE